MAAEQKKPVPAKPRQLPVVTIRGKKYYQDDRLQEYRAVDNPHERIPM